MTKYILNSGGIRKNPERARKFTQEVVRGLGKTPHVLFCLFAALREDWETKFLEYSNSFLALMDDGVKPTIELAFPDKFVEQVKKCDALIIYGGDDFLLLSYFKQYGLPSLWDGKVVAGSSAGSNVLTKYFWTCDWRQVKEGLGILPVKFMSHYRSDFGANDPRGPIDWGKALDELEKYGEGLPINAMEEGDYIVMEK